MKFPYDSRDARQARTARRTVAALLFSALMAGAGSAPVLAQAPAPDGVNVGKPSALRNLVPAAQLEQQSGVQYRQLKSEAARQHALAPDDHPQLKRLRAIAARIVPFARRFNPRAADWNWEVNLIASRNINAFCMPGGKIAFFTGIIDTLKLSDDEIAVVMGHEMAHALREHARERMAKSELTHLGANLLGQMIGGGRYAGLFDSGSSLLTLKFSRDDESEADVVGLDLAARAGFDPRAGVTLWRKMASTGNGAPPQWLSTHPSGTNRIRTIEQHLPEVMPLFESARQQARKQP